MAYPALAEKGVTPVFDEMIEQKLLKSNVFAFYLTSKQDEAAGKKSDLTFGYYDKSKFSGNINGIFIGMMSNSSICSELNLMTLRWAENL